MSLGAVKLENKLGFNKMLMCTTSYLSINLESGVLIFFGTIIKDVRTKGGGGWPKSRHSEGGLSE